MNSQTTIRGDKGEIISLQILGRENTQALDPNDFDWLRANLSISAGPFTGVIELGLTTSELTALRDQLETALRSLKISLHFVTMEENWILNVAFETSGTAVITGSITPNPAVHNTLNYEFHSDPITLEAVARDIRRITEEYPSLLPINR